MNSIRYLAAHNPHSGRPTDADNRRLCFAARHAATAEERQAARHELILRNQPLILMQARIVRQVSRLPLDDLISEGQIALMKAVELFRFEDGFAFSTYATHSIRRHLNRQSWIHGGEIVLPAHLQTRKVRRRLHDDADRARQVVSLATQTRTKRLLADEIPDREQGPTEAEVAAQTVLVRQLLGTLTAREREVVTVRYGLGDAAPRTYAAAAPMFDLTRERVRQIENAAVAKMAEVVGRETA